MKMTPTLVKNSLPVVQMKSRRFSETKIMIEYESIQPYFINVNDELTCCPQDSSVPNDDIWKKFELLPTPPRSPQHLRDDDTVISKREPIPCSLKSEIDLDSCLDDSFVLNNTEETTTTHSDTSYDKHCDCTENTQPKLIKDCMWNGVGHKTIGKSYKTNKTRRTSSPTTDPSICHANGCVDPRNIFPYPVGRPLCCEHQTCRTPAIPTQKARSQDQMTDSEEEIDVVTVESKSQQIHVPKSRNHVSVSNRLQVGQKIMGTLVSKENGLTLVTNTPTNFQSAKTLFKQKTSFAVEDRGRARSKQIHLVSSDGAMNKQQTVAMVLHPDNLTSLKDLKTLDDCKQVKLHVNVQSDMTKHRRHTVEEYHTEGCNADIATNTALMRLANPKSVMQRKDSVSPASRSSAKKRILSLDGISFSSTGGHRQYTNEYNRTKEQQQQIKLPVTTTPNNALSIPIMNSASLKTAQELAINVTARNKTKACKIKSNENDLNEDQMEVIGSPQNKRKRKAEVISTSGSSSCNGSGSGSDNEQIRAAHNVLERQRREGLRTSFHTLRDNVPELRNMEKTPKVNILNKARDYCIQVTEIESSLMSEKERLKRRNYKLIQRLQRVKEAVELAKVVSLESDIESESEEETAPSYRDASDGFLSPESSLPPSPHPVALSAPVATNNRYILARYLQTPDNLSKKGTEVLLCREASCDEIKTNTTMRITGANGNNKTQQQQRNQVKYLSAADLQSLLSNYQASKKVDSSCRNASYQNCEALSDGYEENYDSEEEIARYVKNNRSIAF